MFMPFGARGNPKKVYGFMIGKWHLEELGVEQRHSSPLASLNLQGTYITLSGNKYNLIF